MVYFFIQEKRGWFNRIETMKLKHECLYTRFNGIDYIGLLENGAEASCMHVEIICEYLMAAY